MPQVSKKTKIEAHNQARQIASRTNLTFETRNMSPEKPLSQKSEDRASNRAKAKPEGSLMLTGSPLKTFNMPQKKSNSRESRGVADSNIDSEKRGRLPQSQDRVHRPQQLEPLVSAQDMKQSAKQLRISSGGGELKGHGANPAKLELSPVYC